MVFYIASNTYKEVISRAIKETDEILAGAVSSDEIFLLKYIKENGNQLSGLDMLVIDLTSCQDVDDEIVQALEQIRILDYETRIILLAANRSEGDALLTKCFQMSIYNIICTDDFLEIKNQLSRCLTAGMEYKDAIRFKEVKTKEQLVVKKEIKQVVSKVMIAFAGASARIGVTHHVIVLANYLRAHGFMVAIAEYNNSQAFVQIQEAFGESTLEDGCFSIRGVDYYASSDTNKIGSILGKSYNFVLVDFGCYETCDRVTYNKADVRMIVAGSKPWEVEAVNAVFEHADKETLKQYHFLFNFTPEKDRKTIRESMGEISRVYFLNYTEEPFVSGDFAAADEILKGYMPIQIEKKKGLFRRRRDEK